MFDDGSPGPRSSTGEIVTARARRSPSHPGAAASLHHQCPTTYHHPDPVGRRRGPSTGRQRAAPADGPAILSRQELRQQDRASSTAWWYVFAGLAVVVIGVVIAVVLTERSRQHRRQGGGHDHHGTGRPVATCPLTGLPAPGASCPTGRPSASRSATTPATGRRPASTRPTSCSRNRSRVPSPASSPCSSARAPRWSVTCARPVSPTSGILSQFSDPLFVHAGGITPVIALLAAGPAHRQEPLLGKQRVRHHPALGAGVARTPPS